MSLSPESVAEKLASQVKVLLLSRSTDSQVESGQLTVGPFVESVRTITMGAVTVRAAICRKDVGPLFAPLRSECFIRLEMPGPSNEGTQHIDLDSFQWRLLKKVLESDVATMLLRVMGLGVDSHFRWNGAGQHPEGAMLLHWQLTLREAQDWADAHWDNLGEIEALCDAYEYNFLPLTRCSSNFRIEAKHGYERLAKRRQELRERASSKGTACTLEAVLERALRNWGSAPVLEDVLATLRANLKVWSAQRSSGWRGEDLLVIIEKRIAELGRSAYVLPGHHGGLACPDWPEGARVSAPVGLSGQNFDFPEGVLAFMGYHVGHISTLTEGQRRRILDYVFLGPLPMVNGPDHMRSWGRPRTSTRLREIARSLARFARNAKQQPIGDWGKAISEWENDIAYLKTRYYERRARNWRWPSTGKRGRS